MVTLGNDWDDLLADEFKKDYYIKLRGFLKSEYQNHKIYPDMYDIFNALKWTAYKDTKVVILRMRSVPSLDASALEALYEILEKCKKQGVTVIFSHVNGQPMKLMKKAKFDIDAGRDNFCANIDEALNKAEEIVTA